MPDTQQVIPSTPEERLLAQQNAVNIAKDLGGRPTNITPESVQLLIAAFNNGLNVRSACIYAGISKTAFYNRCKREPRFLDIMERARNNLVELAGARIQKVLRDGEDKVAAPLAWKIFERTMPDAYGQKPPVIDKSKTQNNNFFVLNHDQLSDITKQPDINTANPSELFEALEETSSVDTGGEESSAAQIYQETFQSDDTDTSDM